MKESTDFYSENTKRRRHLSASGIGTRIVLRHKEIGTGFNCLSPSCYEYDKGSLGPSKNREFMDQHST